MIYDANRYAAVSPDGRTIDILSPMQMRLVRVLATYPDRCIDYDTLLAALYPTVPAALRKTRLRALQAHLKAVRAILRGLGWHNDVLTSIPKHGVVFNSTPPVIL